MVTLPSSSSLDRSQLIPLIQMEMQKIWIHLLQLQILLIPHHLEQVTEDCHSSVYRPGEILCMSLKKKPGLSAGFCFSPLIPAQLYDSRPIRGVGSLFRLEASSNAVHELVEAGERHRDAFGVADFGYSFGE